MVYSQPWPIISAIICLLQLSAVTKVKSHYEADKISSLPGQPKANFRQFSGYIAVGEKPARSLFYYFVEAETEPASKPLVLWLNGAANMLYLESPAGVGFSYSANSSFYEYVDDKMTARDNLAFLEKWVEKYPEFKNREFYITGESYGGHYVPQLANLIIQSKAKLNLKGIAIGNPLLEFNSDFNSRAEYLWSHGLISDFSYNQFTFVCNYSQIRRQAETKTLTPNCSRVIKQVSSEISRFVDTYDVTLDVCLSSVVLQSEVLNKLDEPKIDVCVEDETDVYLNRKDVQTALHARLFGVKKWSICSDVLQYDMQNLEIPTIGILGSLVKSNIRVLVYSGDQDSVLPLISTRTLVRGLAKDLDLNTTQPYRAWFEGRQVAGWTQAYGEYLSFATIRGASHEAPFSQPERSLMLFGSFVGGKPLPLSHKMTTQAWSLTLLIICAFHIIIVMTKIVACQSKEADKISSLPGQPNAKFQQYSGYINVDEKQERHLFYYFVEAETDPDSKPLVLWLNGGPGCSSLGGGGFTENGPFYPRGKVLVRNNYSWNKAANMLYLESPAGVGFSYSTNNSFYEYLNDEITARDNLNFLEKWIDRFPEFINRTLYITGESYAGHFVPQLASLVIESKADKFNLQGVAIGNPLLDFSKDYNSHAEFWWSHGLISDSTYNQLTHVCNYSQIISQYYTNTTTPECQRIWELCSSEIGHFVDYYDVALDVCPSPAMLQAQIYESKIDVCVEDEAQAYLNRKDVQEALHARLFGVNEWSMCSDVVGYLVQDIEMPTDGILGLLVKSNIRVLVYSGDQDSVIPLIGTRTLVNKLAEQLGLNTTQPYRAWSEANQVAGWTQSYGEYLSFATIRGASHMAPFSQPKRSLLMFNSFLAGKSLPIVKG
ncbi:serine carboxypeptidase [Striga asiatica]|uniref:Carboxypeptidase n=1 Tax=Striga asiatica TaxID=4170 RepID=A0A5A7R2K6_STRAF|nr:serine carboxypeptidase [Striga asiatica]